MSTSQHQQQPPLPPPLPTMAHSSPGSASNNQLQANCYGTSFVIRPTTAGLLPQPMSIIGKQQVASADGGRINSPSPSLMLSSQAFKDELAAKHSRFSNANHQTQLTIDERIKARKELEGNDNAQQLRAENGSRQSASLIDEQYQATGLPQKLLSSAQQDKRPFAYSPDVNDPNNRGKLDLNQIKSETMRRRLLANMDSTEKDEGHEGQNSSTESSPNNSINFNNNNFDHQQIQYKASNEGKQMVQGGQSVHHESYQQHPIIQYNEPPLFYNTRNHSSNNQEQTFSRSSSKPVASNDYMDELNFEVIKSLDSLSQLVSNLDQPSCEKGSTLLNNHHLQQVPYKQRNINNNNSIEYHPPHQRMSTFLPANDFYNNSPSESMGCYRSSNRSISPAPNSYNSTMMNNNRSLGDYLLSPDSNYFFNNNANSSPYSISPYYSSPLDSETYETSPLNHSSQIRQTSSTFTPRSNFNHQPNLTNYMRWNGQ